MKYIKGDLFDGISGKTNVVVPHIVNNQGAFAHGFVKPLAYHFPQAKDHYHNLVDKYGDFTRECLLGQVQYVGTGPIIANMFAQTLGGKRPLFYNHLVHCMENVANYVLYQTDNFEIVAPKFGSQLAGGDWNFVEELITDIWSNINVTIYYLE